TNTDTTAAIARCGVLVGGGGRLADPGRSSPAQRGPLTTASTRSSCAGSANAEPIATAAAPTARYSAALSAPIPPVATMFTWGKGARTARTHAGPSTSAGNALTQV